jgi:hypothetical protein
MTDISPTDVKHVSLLWIKETDNKIDGTVNLASAD